MLQLALLPFNLLSSLFLSFVMQTEQTYPQPSASSKQLWRSHWSVSSVPEGGVPLPAAAFQQQAVVVGSEERWRADVSLRAGGDWDTPTFWIQGMPCKDLFLTLGSGFGCNDRVLSLQAIYCLIINFFSNKHQILEFGLKNLVLIILGLTAILFVKVFFP